MVRWYESILNAYPLNGFFFLRSNLDGHGHPKWCTPLWRGSLAGHPTTRLACCLACSTWLRTVQEVNECLWVLADHLGGGYRRWKVDGKEGERGDEGRASKGRRGDSGEWIGRRNRNGGQREFLQSQSQALRGSGNEIIASFPGSPLMHQSGNETEYSLIPRISTHAPESGNETEYSLIPRISTHATRVWE